MRIQQRNSSWDARALPRDLWRGSPRCHESDDAVGFNTSLSTRRSQGVYMHDDDDDDEVDFLPLRRFRNSVSAKVLVRYRSLNFI